MKTTSIFLQEEDADSVEYVDDSQTNEEIDPDEWFDEEAYRAEVDELLEQFPIDEEDLWRVE